jgi:hypothetical protein
MSKRSFALLIVTLLSALAGCEGQSTTPAAKFDGTNVAAYAPEICVPTSDTRATVIGPLRSSHPGDPAHSYPWSATDVDLAAHGYVEEEYIFCGKVTGGDYATRMIVRRPVSEKTFSGTVVVEWLNVTFGYDLEALWMLSRDEIMRSGHAYVGISAQRGGLYAAPFGLKSWSPERYGQLRIPLENTFLFVADPQAYEIFDQALRQVRIPDGVAPLGTLKPHTLIVSGASQAAGTIMLYYELYHPRSRLADGFLPFLLTTSSLQAALGLPSDSNIGLPVTTDVVGTPYFLVNSETDPSSLRQPDTEHYRQWEVAGTTHIDETGINNLAPLLLRDAGFDYRAGDASCEFMPRSRIPFHYALNAAMHHLIAWVERGALPPIAPRFEYNAMGGILRDAYGNAAGGLRLSQHHVATAVNNRINSGGAVCTISGHYQPFDTATLKLLYPTLQDYIQRVEHMTAKNLADGYLLPADADATLRKARSGADLH